VIKERFMKFYESLNGCIMILFTVMSVIIFISILCIFSSFTFHTLDQQVLYTPIKITDEEIQFNENDYIDKKIMIDIEDKSYDNIIILEDTSNDRIGI